MSCSEGSRAASNTRILRPVGKIPARALARELGELSDQLGLVSIMLCRKRGPYRRRSIGYRPEQRLKSSDPGEALRRYSDPL